MGMGGVQATGLGHNNGGNRHVLTLLADTQW